ncbi:MAG TPA: 2,3-diaminopropionate biosynthesis protein SbnB [Verrucomicrobiae bacterium]|nr:2,3-diaminopropionate biosynthesis protein SbnB [Verrucomicrobiae bacterium]
MLYLNEKDLKKIGLNWNATIDNIELAVHCLEKKDFVQPIKPYLRYRDLTNRIIALIAFVGGKINLAGIKWIASFPDNINHGLPRAHSVVILNEADTGVPLSVINTALLSIVRTASVSGLMIRHFLKARPKTNLVVSIMGWGPIGQHHYKMVCDTLKDKIAKIYLYDLRGIKPETITGPYKDKTVVAKNWQEAYRDADIFITCTVSKAPYVDEKPKAGSLQLNCSLRDYKTNILDYTKNIIVDDWEEVCREKTDIEMMHKERGLQAKDTKSIVDVVCKNCMASYPKDEAVMFNPMGMGVFDIATGRYYLDIAKKMKVGTELE